MFGKSEPISKTSSTVNDEHKTIKTISTVETLMQTDSDPSESTSCAATPTSQTRTTPSGVSNYYNRCIILIFIQSRVSLIHVCDMVMETQ